MSTGSLWLDLLGVLAAAFVGWLGRHVTLPKPAPEALPPGKPAADDPPAPQAKEQP